MSKQSDIVINFTDKFVIIKSKLGLDKIKAEEYSKEVLAEVVWKHVKGDINE